MKAFKYQTNRLPTSGNFYLFLRYLLKVSWRLCKVLTKASWGSISLPRSRFYELPLESLRGTRLGFIELNLYECTCEITTSLIPTFLADLYSLNKDRKSTFGKKQLRAINLAIYTGYLTGGEKTQRLLVENLQY